MKIAIPYKEGKIVQPLSDCRTLMILTTKDTEPVAKELVPCDFTGTTAMLKLVGLRQIDVFICGQLGISTRNALEMLGVVIVPGVTGSCDEAAARFLAGEDLGDPSVLSLCREEDPDDPMNCMHDCSRCAGCGPIAVPDEVRRRVPEV